MSKYFKILNAMPSFDGEYRRVDGGQTFDNPYPNYGDFGKHLEDYFYHGMRETPSGGADKLAVYLNSQAGMTSIVASGLTGLRNHIFTRFGATSDTAGYGLLDFRGSTSWNIITGDGIIGPSNQSSTAYIETITAAGNILSDLKTHMPSISWTYAGYPAIPHITAYAPVQGSSPVWGPGLTNTGVAATNHWDASQATGGSSQAILFMWYSTPPDLKRFYTFLKLKDSNTTDSFQRNLGWLCPDITPIHDTHGVSKNWYSVQQMASYTRDVISACEVINQPFAEGSIGDGVPLEVYPLISSVYHSRNVGYLDDHTGYFTEDNTVNIVDQNQNPVQEVRVFSGFTGSDFYASDAVIDEGMFKSGMIQAAARTSTTYGQVNGFVYLDQLPFLIDLSCTGTETDATRRVAQRRARNFIQTEVLGYSLQISFSSGFWRESKNSVTSYLANEYAPNKLRFISESIPVGDPNWRDSVGGTGDGTRLEITGFDSVRWDSRGNSDPELYQNLYNLNNACCPSPTVLCCRQGSSSCGVCGPEKPELCTDGYVVENCQECQDTWNPIGACLRQGTVCFECVEPISYCDCIAIDGKHYSIPRGIPNPMEQCIRERDDLNRNTPGCNPDPPDPEESLGAPVVRNRVPIDFEFDSQSFQIERRNVSKLANNSGYYNTLPTNNSYLISELNFRANSPPTATTASRVKAQVSNDLSFIKYTYIP
jgi:hypothetical protein